MSDSERFGVKVTFEATRVEGGTKTIQIMVDEGDVAKGDMFELEEDLLKVFCDRFAKAKQKA